ncbi:MAG TPA: CoA transferase [Candidatus Binataceae bacterium]|nr:CoA transferase [Candidatus Binataceae bacterium]
MATPPLEGIRVADFTWVWAGPYCTLQLAHLGADVIRIETKTRPCITRVLPPWPEGKPGGLNRSGYFNQYNQGKRSLTLNFKDPAAHEVARKLIAKSDVVTNNFAHGVMDRMGFGYEQLKKIKPDIIMISLSGYGDTGPYRDYVAYGPAQVPLSGLSSLTGYKGWPPMHAGFSYADPNAGVHGAFAVLAALYHRAKTGQGQYIDMSQWECAMTLLPEGILEYTFNGREPERDGNRDPMMAPHGIFKCLDRPEKVAGNTIDQWVAIVCADDTDWGRLARAIERPELATEPKFATLASRKRNEDELEAIITQWTVSRRAADIARSLQHAGVPAAVVADNKYLSEEDAHIRARDYFVFRDHPEVGKRQHAGIPWKLGRTETSVRAAAPTIGQHTDEVLEQLLGYSADEITNLRAQGALE